MPFHWVEVIAKDEALDAVRKAADAHDLSDFTLNDAGEGRSSLRLLVGAIDRQALLDDLQDALDAEGDWRIVVSEISAVTPQTETEKERSQAAAEEDAEASQTASREELFQSVVTGAALSLDYLVLVALSALVAGIGLVRDDVAVVIGAMLIAPLLGPALAFAFGTALGDRALIGRALLTLAAGFALAILLPMGLPLVTEPDFSDGALKARGEVDLGSLALALASGSAAALSLTAGVSTTLVGVMVAAALLPPAAAIGLALASAEIEAGSGAALLLGVNVAAVSLAAILVFLAKGIRPRSWHEREGAAQSVRATVAILVAVLALMAGLIAVDVTGR